MYPEVIPAKFFFSRVLHARRLHLVLERKRRIGRNAQGD